MERIDHLGLDDLDRAFMKALIQVYEGGPAGIEAIAATLGEERDTLEDVVEPYLLQIGFVRRTKRGGKLRVPHTTTSDWWCRKLKKRLRQPSRSCLKNQ